VSGGLAIGFTFLAWWTLKRVKIHKSKQKHEVEKYQNQFIMGQISC
jgi:hypothetical protein